MSQVKTLSGRGIPLKGDDIDTDRIIPARFLRAITFEGLGARVFADDRVQSQGKHPFDLPQYQGAKILVVNANFGCGSSREHAPQAIMRWGIQGIIGESFAEIFLGNCLANGIPCVTADSATVKRLQTLIENDSQSSIDLCLEQREVRSGDFIAPVTLEESSRQMLLEGTWDTCGQLIQNVDLVCETASRLPYLTRKK